MKVLFEFAHESLLYWTQNESETKLAYWGSSLPVADAELDADQRKAIENCRLGRYTPIYSEVWRTLDPDSWLLQLLASGRLTELVWVTPESEPTVPFDFKLSEQRLQQILGVPYRAVPPSQARDDFLTHYDLSFAEAHGLSEMPRATRLLVSCSIRDGKVDPKLRPVADGLIDGGELPPLDEVEQPAAFTRARRALVLGHWERALAELKQAAEESPPDAVMCYWLETEALRALGKLDPCVNALEELFEDPRITRSLEVRVALRLARCLVDKGEIKAARGWIRKARSQDRKHPEALRLLAACEEKDDELGRATKHWRQLARLYPDRLSTLEVYRHLIRLYEAQGKKQDAKNERRRLQRKQRSYRMSCRDENPDPIRA